MKNNNQNESAEDETVDEKNVDASSSDFISCYFNDDRRYSGLLEDDS
jgi:hypothetical protein